MRLIARTPGVLEAEVDGDRVLMHPDDFSYYGLSDTGDAVWQLIDGHRTVGDIVTALAGEYGADADAIRPDVVEFLTGLMSARLAIYAD